ncbi:MAG TPA: chromate resistance protein ChrB domain-containing protein [Stellaceae bacterium]|nr:chromate resistance protein ChrB domain-containing protein [Stellaceae bacterium]
MSFQPALADIKPRNWLLLMHQLPPEPAYFRVKIWRRIQGLGAVALKNSVYALPSRDDTREDFQWILREIAAGGGEGTLVEARLVDGFTDEELEALFQAARDADYQEIAEEARTFARDLDQAKGRVDADAALRRLRRRIATVAAIDFFGATGRLTTEGLISALEERLGGETPAAAPTPPLADFRGRVWVTRQGVHVDRIASLWLVRRFVDPAARVKFVPPKGYRPEPGEIRIDMFEAEFTHEGDRCTFEVLLDRLGLTKPALTAIGEIVHDIDLKDAKFEREETAGVAHLIAGLCMAERDDETRLARGFQLFDDLHTYFRRKRS